MEIKLKLNGKLIAGQAEADTVLLDFLREGAASASNGAAIPPTAAYARS